MGIDPVTHEPLNKQVSSQDSSSPAEHLPQPGTDHQVKETDGVLTSQENSSSSTPAENSSGEDSLLLDSICSDESLMNSLWLDETPLVDALWVDSTPTSDNTNKDMGLSSWEDNCAWLLDCQDFGVHDFGFNCFSEIESNALQQTIGMEEKGH